MSAAYLLKDELAGVLTVHRLIDPMTNGDGPALWLQAGLEGLWREAASEPERNEDTDEKWLAWRERLPGLQQAMYKLWDTVGARNDALARRLATVTEDEGTRTRQPYGPGHRQMNPQERPGAEGLAATPSPWLSAEEAAQAYVDLVAGMRAWADDLEPGTVRQAVAHGCQETARRLAYPVFRQVGTLTGGARAHRPQPSPLEIHLIGPGDTPQPESPAWRHDIVGTPIEDCQNALAETALELRNALVLACDRRALQRDAKRRQERLNAARHRLISIQVQIGALARLEDDPDTWLSSRTDTRSWYEETARLARHWHFELIRETFGDGAAVDLHCLRCPCNSPEEHETCTAHGQDCASYLGEILREPERLAQMNRFLWNRHPVEVQHYRQSLRWRMEWDERITPEQMRRCLEATTHPEPGQ